jgi:NADH-quinone oxidoreductase subunit E
VSAESKLHLITEASREAIDRKVAQYPSDWKRGAMMPALEIAQEQNGGWLTDDLVEAVAEYLEQPAIAAFEVATFYSMYEMEPVGRHKIAMCTNVSCMLCGSDRIVDHLKKRLGIGFGETTSDGRFTLKEVECLGACAGAPVFLLGHQYYENLTPERVDEILDQLD